MMSQREKENQFVHDLTHDIIEMAGLLKRFVGLAIEDGHLDGGPPDAPYCQFCQRQYADTPRKQADSNYYPMGSHDDECLVTMAQPFLLQYKQE